MAALAELARTSRIGWLRSAAGMLTAVVLLAAAALVVGSLLLQWPLNGLLAAVPALLVPLWLGRRLGGHSGDSYGACVEWSEALGLLLIALFS